MLLDSQIEVFRLCVRINRLRYQIVRDYSMNPKFAGLASAASKLNYNLGLRSEKVLARISSAGDRADAAFNKVEATLDATEQAAADIEAFANSLDGSNGGPTLSDSSDTSGQSQAAQVAAAQAAEPAASWGAK
ncbi:MAG: hypothetical protein JWP25_8838 [Bradyrhizobium sp.]|nr:hypothetical protein [Bradyrhizobium sp.]